MEMYNSKREFDRSVELKENSMLRKRPDLFNNWDFDKNDKLGLDIYKITLGSNKIVWWLCPVCNEQDKTSVNRYRKNKKGCCNKGYLKTNSLTYKHPEIASEWNISLNGNISPSNISSGSGRKFWWTGKCGHVWNTSVSNRTISKSGCPYCSNQKLLVGFNDMWTTDPDLASLLADPEDGYKYMFGSKSKVNWKCKNCDTVINNKRILYVKHQGIPCPYCKDGASRPEKTFYSLLEEFEIDFENQKTFPWLSNRVYDFYIPKFNLIVELHGVQHTKMSGYSSTQKKLEEQKRIDKLKKEKALKNGITKYVEIHCIKTEFLDMRDNIVKSDILKVLGIAEIPEHRWKNIYGRCLESLNYKALLLWEEGYLIHEIASAIKMNRNTISKILRNYEAAGICEYDPKRGTNRKRHHRIYQFDKNYKLLKIWDGTGDMFDEFTAVGVSNCCRGVIQTHRGYIWVYEQDLEKRGLLKFKNIKDKNAS